MGVPDGAGGLIVRYVLQEKMNQHAIHTIRFEPFALNDCCASPAQYAMGSGCLDIAVMCSDAARVLVTKDPRYEIAFPVIKNSDIFIARADDSRRDLSIAVSQNRDFQQKMVKQRYGERGCPVPMLHSGVPFAYSKGIVQGAVVDITKAFTLDGVLSSAADNGDDFITHVMVIKKSLKNNDTFRQFIEIYDQAVRETDSPERLLHLLRICESTDYTMREVEIWQKFNVRFMHSLKVDRKDRPVKDPIRSDKDNLRSDCFRHIGFGMAICGAILR